MSKRQLAVIGRVHGLQKSGIILYALELYSPPRLGRTTRSSSQQPLNTPLQTDELGVGVGRGNVVS